MTRSRLLVAFVRVLFISICLCLFGAARSHQDRSLAALAALGHVDPVDAPDPGDALAEQPRGNDRDTGDGDTRQPSRTGFIVASNSVQRVIMARGPPSDPHPIEGRPRSSRGPPEQV